MEKAIFFTRHAELKLLLLSKHGFKVTKQEIRDLLRRPSRIRAGYGRRKIAERPITSDHILRVVFEELSSELKVITMYPGRRDRYESKL